MTDITNRIFKTEKAARKYLEAQRWPRGPFCPHCGDVEQVRKLEGDKHRPGLYQCNSCRQQFTVTVGTVFERSKIPLHKWLLATHLLTSSKKGMSAHQLHRMLGVTYKTAWFMAHRLREAMRDENPSPMGGGGKSVQADETYFGHKAGRAHERKGKNPPMSAKRAVVSLVSEGKARTFHVVRADSQTVRRILVTNVLRETELHTDESRLYTRVGREFADHKTVVHVRGQYVGPSGETTNAVENYFSVFENAGAIIPH